MSKLTRIRILAIEAIRQAIVLLPKHGLCRPSDWTGLADRRLTICLALELAADYAVSEITGGAELLPRVTDEAILLVMRQVSRANGSNALLQLQALKPQTALGRHQQADALDAWQERITSVGVVIIVLQRAGQLTSDMPQPSAQALAGDAA